MNVYGYRYVQDNSCQNSVLQHQVFHTLSSYSTIAPPRSIIILGWFPPIMCFSYFRFQVQGLIFNYDSSYLKQENYILFEPRREKNRSSCFRPGVTQTGLYSRKMRLEA